MKVTRKIIEIDEELCNGCGLCVPDCAEGSLQIIDGKAKLVADKLCDGLGACLGSCPTGALRIIEREAEEFDEEAVEEYLAAHNDTLKEQKNSTPVGCPSAQLQMMQPASSCQASNEPATQNESNLSHWPVQIRLIPPTAPFLENADLLVAADCTAIAYPNIQRDYVAGRVVMMGCPKFDDQQLYVDRFTDIFSNRKIKTLTVLIMEVPCCNSMLHIIKDAFNKTNPTFPVQQVVISREGKVLQTKTW
ncbi:ATP-binding protein [Desulfogranum japonicum]|uniref:ATP-binding protein n=1 Tax=Desulfogranum japonicum TaxID=231447 RepID=UPI00041DF265|nr:4Fe-4S dicluster domain-containing protein [Desulfogranum japonicum]